MTCGPNGYYTVSMTPNNCCQPEVVAVPVEVPVPVKPEINFFADNRSYPTTNNEYNTYNTTNNTYVTKNYNFTSNSTYTTNIYNLPERRGVSTTTVTEIGSKAQSIFDKVRTSHSSSCDCKPAAPKHNYFGSLFGNFASIRNGGRNTVVQQNGGNNYARVSGYGNNVVAQQNGRNNIAVVRGNYRNAVVQQNGNNNYANIGEAFMQFSDRFKG